MRRPTRPSLLAEKAGFTILELLIATLVFSVILVVVTFAVLTFTKSYYKGVNTSTTQTAARAISDAAAQAIEFGTKTVSSASSGSVQTWCFGNTQLDYVLNKEVTYPSDPNAATHVHDALWQTAVSSTGGCTSLAVPAASSQELLGPHLRLLKFTITPVANLPVSALPTYTINVQVGYGDDDLLCNSSAPGDCTANGNSTHLQDPGETDTCKEVATSAFCVVSSLTTTAQMRERPQ